MDLDVAVQDGSRTIDPELLLPRLGDALASGSAMLSLTRFALGVLAIGNATVANASPPPPPPLFVEDIARQLLQAPSQESFDTYARLLADDLKVTVNGKIVAASKGAWLAIEQRRLGHIERFIYGYAADRESVLILDRFDDQSDEHCPPGAKCVFDPRYIARASRFEIGADRLVHQIRIIQSSSIMRTP